MNNSSNKKEKEFQTNSDRYHVRVNNKPTVQELIEKDREDYENLINDSDITLVGIKLIDRVVTNVKWNL